jgi:tetratricopeptide (TPR) repeat protein
METLDEVGGLFKQLEDAEYYSDAEAITKLSRQIHAVLNSIGEEMLAEPGQRVDAANVFLSSAEVIQPIDFHAAVLAIKRALHVLGDAANTSRDGGDLRQAADAYKKIGDVHAEMLGDALEARRFYLAVIECDEKALKFSEGLTKPLNEALYNQYYTIAELHFMVSDWSRAEQLARVAIEASKKAGKYYMVATSYKLLFQIALQAGKKEQLLQTFYEARDYFEALLQKATGQQKKANFMQIAEIYHVFASFYDLLEDVGGFKDGSAELSEKEAGCYIDIAKDYERQDDDIGSALHYHSAGLVLKKIRDLRGARDAFERSARHYEAVGELDSAADNYLESGNCMESSNEFLETIKFIQKANMLYEQAGFVELAVANSYRALDVHDYLVPGNTILRPSILKMLTSALGKLVAIREKSGDYRDAAQYEVELAQVWFQENETEQCFQHLKKAMEMLKSSHSEGGHGNAAACNGMLAIVVIGLIMEHDGEVTNYLSLLRTEGEKTPVGRDYAGVAWQLATEASSGKHGAETPVKAPIIFNNPLLRNLVAMWTSVHESRVQNR